MPDAPPIPLSESASSQLSDLQSVRVFWPLSVPSGINPLWLLIELYYAGVSNCGLTASAKIYVLPDALKGWRQHWCNGLRQVGTVSWSFHRFLPTDTLRASKSCWMARASALQECICANRDSQNLHRGIMNALSISYATITPRTSESLYGLVPISLCFLH